jgi:hypothetical protein
MIEGEPFRLRGLALSRKERQDAADDRAMTSTCHQRNGHTHARIGTALLAGDSVPSVRELPGSHSPARGRAFKI